MPCLEIDNTLSGVIVLLVLFILWKRHSESKDAHLIPQMRGDMPRRTIPEQSPAVSEPEKPKLSEQEPFEVEEHLAGGLHGLKHVGPRPTMDPADFSTEDYESTVQNMALESGVGESHKRYCNSLSFAGLPTGSSSCTTLEETGRSYGTADFVGLTARKFCKARQLATPAPDTRITPSQSIVEWCDIDMDSLI